MHKWCIQRTKRKVKSKVGTILLCIVLLVGVSAVPTMQIGVHAITIASINPLINNVAQRIGSGIGGDVSLIAQVLQQIATQVSDTAGEASATQTINRIASE